MEETRAPRGVRSCSLVQVVRFCMSSRGESLAANFPNVAEIGCGEYSPFGLGGRIVIRLAAATCLSRPRSCSPRVYLRVTYLLLFYDPSIARMRGGFGAGRTLECPPTMGAPSSSARAWSCTHMRLVQAISPHLYSMVRFASDFGWRATPSSSYDPNSRARTPCFGLRPAQAWSFGWSVRALCIL